MEGNYTFTGSRLLAGLCWVQGGAATVAAVATLVEVESIIFFCPGIALLGFVLALFSLKNMSLNLLLFGLACPVVTSMIALSIATWNWSPAQAAIPVSVMLTLNAAVTVVWAALTARQLARPRSLEISAAKPRFRFSLRGLFGLVTLACILLALLRQLDVGNEMAVFAVYGISVLVLALAAAISFWHRGNRVIREAAVIGDQTARRPTSHGRTAESPLA